MILVAFGANLPSPAGEPRETIKAAMDRLAILGVEVIKRSRFYRTSPVPPSGQPDFVNMVAEVRSDLSAEALLQVLHKIEKEFGRTRKDRWEARSLDLDLLAFHETVTPKSEVKSCTSLMLPHPRLHERRFVLEPLAEIAPGWVHPLLLQTSVDLLAALPTDGECEPISDC